MYLYENTLFMQVALFLHGRLKHSSTSKSHNNPVNPKNSKSGIYYSSFFTLLLLENYKIVLHEKDTFFLFYYIQKFIFEIQYSGSHI